MVSLLTVADAGASSTEVANVGSAHQLQAPRAIELEDDTWFLAAYGCSTIPEADKSCSDSRLFFFHVTSDGKAQETGSMGGIDQPTFALIGLADATHVVIDLEHNDVPEGDHILTDKVLATYSEQYVTVDAVKGSVRELAWRPPAMTYPPVVSDLIPTQPEFKRVNCASAGSLFVVDSVPAGDTFTTTLTVASLKDDTAAKPVPVQLAADENPVALYCTHPAGLALVTTNESAKTVQVQTVDAGSGQLGVSATEAYSGELWSLQTGQDSAVVRTGVRPTTVIESSPDQNVGTDEQVHAFALGKWSHPVVDAGDSDQIWISGDGASLLLRSPAGFTGRRS